MILKGFEDWNKGNLTIRRAMWSTGDLLRAEWRYKQTGPKRMCLCSSWPQHDKEMTVWNRCEKGKQRLMCKMSSKERQCHCHYLGDLLDIIWNTAQVPGYPHSRTENSLCKRSRQEIVFRGTMSAFYKRLEKTGFHSSKKKTEWERDCFL